ncbi:MAG TPA: HAMP domain-containing histidine kinase, partial [Bacteroidetes bacterium]|nr:HAMP domain-containing histidine kinase [Bacteroidota bacterium]
ELNESSFSVGKMFEELYARLSVMKQKRNKDLVALLLSRPREPADLDIVADRYRLEQIMMNLAENAMKFTDRGVIEIGFRMKNENTLQLFVKDTGRGIDAGHQQMIFESFRISRKETDPHIAGSGLGLSIVKSLVELMKGEVWVEPNEEQGSIFKINLPLKKQKSAEAGKEKKGTRRSFLDDLRLGSRHLAI